MERLFEEPASAAPAREPLAARMRPRTLEELVGQQALLAPGAPLRRAIEAGRPHSMILYGPPGSGKTTLARIVAHASGAAFEELSAIEAGLPEVRRVLERARRRDGATVFFLDEIHRFSRPQQDALLRAVEEGTVILIGASTESPRHQVSGALLSRLRVYEVEGLREGDLRALLERALARGELGAVSVDAAAIALIAGRAGGDARVALGALELAASGREAVDAAAAQAAIDTAFMRYDAAGDHHYETISAWIKATRASDPDASLYYLATMLEGGEDPRFIARRMVILASEDVGNADPQALALALATAGAVELLGLPECAYALAQAAIYLALAPKSNAAGVALGAARAEIRERGARRPPQHLRPNAKGYDYPHDHRGHLSPQELMPAGLEGARFYRPDEAEAQLAATLAAVRAARGQDRG
ncbi:MAG TPA: replication-associated recombination protein A [Solirubrobacteraceae bacterium]|nr:replication-associated recombination protein A [Solirubrobacteraceae bacterium]